MSFEQSFQYKALRLLFLKLNFYLAKWTVRYNSADVRSVNYVSGVHKNEIFVLGVKLNQANKCEPFYILDGCNQIDQKKYIVQIKTFILEGSWIKGG